MNGGIDAGFRLDGRHLFLEGWLALAGPSPRAVSLRDDEGRLHAAVFHFHAYDRPDVAGVAVAAGLVARGCRVVVETDGRCPRPVRVVFHAADSASLELDLHGCLAAPTTDAEKLAHLMRFPDPAVAARCCREAGLAAGRVERVARTAGGLVVEGWACAPDTRFVSARLTSLAGETVEATSIHAGERPDVAAATAGQVPADYGCVGIRVRFRLAAETVPVSISLQPEAGRPVVLPVPAADTPGVVEAPAKPVVAVDGRPPEGVMAWYRLDHDTLVAVGRWDFEGVEAPHLETSLGRLPLSAAEHFGVPRNANSPAAPNLIVRAAVEGAAPLGLWGRSIRGGELAVGFPQEPEDAGRLGPRLAELVPLWSRGLPAQEKDRLEAFAYPLIAECLTQAGLRTGVAEVLAFGPAPRTPVVSVVIPGAACSPNLSSLQLLTLGRDPVLSAADVVVVAPPSGREEWHALLRRHHRLYGISARLLVLSQPAGPTTAQSLGALAAVGKNLLFLGPDVVPNTADAGAQLLAALAGRTAVAGARIEYHDGLVFQQGLELVEGAVAYPGQGLPARLGGRGVRDVPAVGGGVLLTTARAYRAVGGFCEAYFSPLAADFDYCARQRKAGLGVVCHLGVGMTWFELDRSRLPRRAPPGQAEYDSARLAGACGPVLSKSA